MKPGWTSCRASWTSVTRPDKAGLPLSRARFIASRGEASVAMS